MSDVVLVDTNIIIYYLNGDMNAYYFLEKHQGRMAVSLVTVTEVLSYPFDEISLNNVNEFLRNEFEWLSFSEQIAFKSAEIRRHKKMKTADAMIAGTALIYGLKLATRNIKDFKHLPIILENPMD